MSALLVGVGLWIRLRIAETPEFAAALADAPPPKVPIGEAFGRFPGLLLAGTIGAVACFVLYYVATAFLLSYGTKTLHYTMQQFLLVQLGAILFMALGILLSGWLSDRQWDERRVLIGGCVGTAIVGLVMAPFMESGSLALVFAYMAAALFMMGFVYGPLGGWLPSLYPPRVRYTAVSIAFNLAGVLGGGLTPLMAQMLSAMGGLAPVGWYASGAALLSLVALIAAGGAGRSDRAK